MPQNIPEMDKDDSFLSFMLNAMNDKEARDKLEKKLINESRKHTVEMLKIEREMICGNLQQSFKNILDSEGSDVGLADSARFLDYDGDWEKIRVKYEIIERITNIIREMKLEELREDGG